MRWSAEFRLNSSRCAQKICVIRLIFPECFNSMDLSIIVPSHNTEKLLKRCLDSIVNSLHDTDLEYEIIVIDNASTDNSRRLAGKYQHLTLIVNRINSGYGKANNQGIARARGNYILLLNSDTQAQSDALSLLVKCAREHPRSFIGGKLLNEDGTDQTSCGRFFTIPVVILALFFKGDYLGLTRESPDRMKRVDWVSGACLIASKKSFIEVGLFDEGIFMYLDEVDLLYRANLLGYTTIFCPTARFVHTGAASSKNNRAPVANIFSGLVYFYRKHYSVQAQNALGWLLRIKAYLAIAAGKMFGKQELVNIYEKALALVS